MATYVIPDIHGCIRTLEVLLERKVKLRRTDRVIFLGDYIDRGPDSAAVVDYILGLIDSGYGVVTLMGNHERMLLDAFEGDRAMESIWIINAGLTTVASYRRRFPELFDSDTFLPESHFRFFSRLPYYRIEGKTILVHGGINYTIDDPFQDKEAMLWLRADELPESFMPGYRVIHGHTPKPLHAILERLGRDGVRLINLDAGCVYRGNIIQGTGYLTALNLDTMELSFVECVDKW